MGNDCIAEPLRPVVFIIDSGVVCTTLDDTSCVGLFAREIQYITEPNRIVNAMPMLIRNFLVSAISKNKKKKRRIACC